MRKLFRYAKFLDVLFVERKKQNFKRNKHSITKNEDNSKNVEVLKLEEEVKIDEEDKLETTISVHPAEAKEELIFNPELQEVVVELNEQLKL